MPSSLLLILSGYLLATLLYILPPIYRLLISKVKGYFLELDLKATTEDQ